jgi:hypothetical protein
MKSHKEMALTLSQMATNTQEIGTREKDKAMLSNNSPIMKPILDLLKTMNSTGKVL